MGDKKFRKTQGVYAKEKKKRGKKQGWVRNKAKGNMLFLSWEF